MKPATHEGHCQVCGRQQALPGGVLSKHGYTVDWGYFIGVCRGERQKPLQQDRTICDTIVADLRARAVAMDADIAAIDAGTLKPKFAQANHHWQVRDRQNKWVMVEVLFADANVWAQQDAVRALRQSIEQQAKHYRDHATAMEKLAARIHGTALLPRADEGRKVIVPGCYITTGGKRYLVHAVEERQARSWSARSRFGKHAAIKNSEGKTFWIACSTIRQDKIELPTTTKENA